MLSPQEKKDKIIRSTDLEALTCRHSSNAKSYFDPLDHFITDLISSYQDNLQYCSGYTNLSAGRALRSILGERKLPLINRGTYFRTKLIDLIVNQFISEFENCQIISLGGGSDTRGFKLLERMKGIEYFEIDFPESVRIKKLAILHSQHLQDVIGWDNPPTVSINSREDFQNLTPDVHTSRYHLVGFDLRNIEDANLNGKITAYFDKSKPTLILSECVLCYLSPEENESIIKFWKDQNASLLSFLIYEPISLDDAFGETMTKNLSTRGINLLTFDKFPTLSSKLSFFSEKCGMKKVRLTDLSDIGGYNTSSSNDNPWISISELRRINRLELIDEVEEIKLLLEHYCLCYGESNKLDLSFNGIDKWKWSLVN